MNVKLKELIAGVSAKNSKRIDYPVFSVTNKTGFCPAEETFSKQVFSDDLVGYKIVDKGMFAYNPSRINVGSIGLLKERDHVLVSPIYEVFSIDEKRLDPDYLYLFLTSELGKNAIKANTQGTIRNSLKLNLLGRITIVLPSLPEQKRVVEEMKQMRLLLENENKKISLLDELIKSRFVELVGGLEGNKFGYPSKRLDEVFEFIKDGTHQTPEYTDVAEHIFLSSGNVITGKIDWVHVKYIPDELHTELSEHLKPRTNDILLAKNGTTGIAALVDKDIDFDVYVSLAVLRPKENEDPVFLLAAINCPDTKQQFDASLKGIGVPNLHLHEIAKTKIILPPMCIQKEFVSFKNQTDKLKFSIQNEIQTVEEMYRKKIFAYFN